MSTLINLVYLQQCYAVINMHINLSHPSNIHPSSSVSVLHLGSVLQWVGLCPLSSRRFPTSPDFCLGVSLRLWRASSLKMWVWRRWWWSEWVSSSIFIMSSSSVLQLIGKLEQKCVSLPCSYQRALCAEPEDVMYTTPGDVGIFYDDDGELRAGGTKKTLKTASLFLTGLLIHLLIKEHKCIYSK